MSAWKKSKPTGQIAYAVIPVGNQFGVGLFSPGKPPERVRSVGLRMSDSKLQPAVDRLNTRSGVSKEAAARIVGGGR